MVGTNKGQWIRGLKEELADQFKWWFVGIYKGMGGGVRGRKGRGDDGRGTRKYVSQAQVWYIVQDRVE